MQRSCCPASNKSSQDSEEKASLWVSKTIGDVEIERVKLTTTSGMGGKNYSVDDKLTRIIPQRSRVADLHAVLKHAITLSVRFSLPDIP